jgi:hypothetical protein
VGGHVEVQYAPMVMRQHQEYVKDLETKGGRGKKSMETSCVRWFSRKVRQVRDGGLRLRTIYLLTLVSLILIPSLSKSPWIMAGSA